MVGGGASPGRGLGVDVRQISGLLQRLSHFFGQTQKISGKQSKLFLKQKTWKSIIIGQLFVGMKFKHHDEVFTKHKTQSLRMKIIFLPLLILFPAHALSLTNSFLGWGDGIAQR